MSVIHLLFVNTIYHKIGHNLKKNPLNQNKRFELSFIKKKTKKKTTTPKRCTCMNENKSNFIQNVNLFITFKKT